MTIRKSKGHTLSTLPVALLVLFHLIFPNTRQHVTELGCAMRTGFDPAHVEAVLEAGGELPLPELLRCRVRYFTDGVVLGGRLFVEDTFQRYRSRAARDTPPAHSDLTVNVGPLLAASEDGDFLPYVSSSHQHGKGCSAVCRLRRRPSVAA